MNINKNNILNKLKLALQNKNYIENQIKVKQTD